MDPKTLKLLRDLLKDLLKNVATKDDLKKALSNYPTKSDLTKALEKYASKDDLLEMEKRLLIEIRDVEGFTTVNADKHKADKVDLEALEERVDKIEQKIAN